MAPKTNRINKEPSESIAWPALSRSSTSLFLVELLSDLLVIDHLFSPSVLALFLAFLNSPAAPVLTPSPPKQRGEASRTNHRFGIKDPHFAKEIWDKTGLKELCTGEGGLVGRGKNRTKPVGLNSNIRLYCYETGSYFGPHYDDDCIDKATGYRSEWTLLIYLTGEDSDQLELKVKGGETSFYPTGLGKTSKSVDVPLREGRALLHRHGADCMLHEGKVVEKGVKWVLRSDVMMAPV